LGVCFVVHILKFMFNSIGLNSIIIMKKLNEKIIIDEDDCKVILVEKFIDKTTITGLKKDCLALPFSSKETLYYGKKVKTPRKTCSIHFGDKEMIYKYSGFTETTTKSPESYVQLKKKVDEYVKAKEGEEFNYALLNYYKDGEDSILQHSDNEKCIVPESTIASISFGTERKFIMKRIKDKKKIEIPLKNGSLLLMMGKTQEKWTHGINKSKKIKNERYNVTFRRNQ
jgi:alkylated DNA repair dioxygenase AlkB